MRRFSWLVIPLLFAGLLGGCATAKKDDGLRARIWHYAAAVRWNEFETASTFVDPAVLAENPFDEAAAARWSQVQVARYVEGAQTVDAEGRVLQTVQIEIIDRSTQSVRNIVDRQRWRFDAATGQWWNETGLPDLDAAK